MNYTDILNYPEAIVLLAIWGIYLLLTAFYLLVWFDVFPRLLSRPKYWLNSHDTWETILTLHFVPTGIVELIVFFIVAFPIALIYTPFEWAWKKTHPTPPPVDDSPKTLEDMIIDEKRTPMVMVSAKAGFVPSGNQVLYIENEYDDEVNRYIQENYERLKRFFRIREQEFIYLPYEGKRFFDQETLKYTCPWLTDESLEKMCMDSSWIMKYVNTMTKPCFFSTVDGKNINLCPPAQYIKPGLIVSTGLGTGETEEDFYYEFRYYPVITRNDIEENLNIYKSALSTAAAYSRARYEDSGTCDDTFHQDTEKIMEEIRERVEKLRAVGIDEALINELFQKQERLSRVLITKDWRVVLTDYNNMEIEMTALPKAVFFLFLRHPEGIVFKELENYRRELAYIYNKLTNRSDNDAIQKSIEDVTNPLKNSINEKCARIRESFIGKFSETLARNYFVTGRRGEPKRIMLDRSFVTWENDIETSMF